MLNEVSIYFANYISLGLYALVVWLGYSNLRKCHFISNPLRKIFVLYIITSILTSVVFVSLQLDWIISNHNQLVGDTISFWWLLFDYVNAFAYIFAMVGVSAMIDLRHKWDKE
jgi:hypothetical protein